MKLTDEMLIFLTLYTQFLIHMRSDLSFHFYTVLDIERCDLDIKNNSRSHHTDLCGEERLIVRRGQPFNVILHLKACCSEVKPSEASFTLIVETGMCPNNQ